MRCFYSLLLLLLFLYSSGNVRDTLVYQLEQSIDLHDPALPFIDISFDLKISDISICKGPDRVFYVTGTTANSGGVQHGIQVWASRDLKEWNLVGRNNGYVWTFDDDGAPWQKEITEINGVKKRAIVSPGIFYLHNTFWISYTNTNTNQSGILRSRSGRAGGPYDEVKEDGFMVRGGQASLFMDSDSSTYFIWGNGMVHQMLPDMTGFADSGPRALPLANNRHVAGKRVMLSKVEQNYYLQITNVNIQHAGINPHDQSSPVGARSDGVILKSTGMFTAYTPEVVIPYGGNGLLFEDFDRKHWYVFAGNESGNPLGGAQAFVSLNKTNEGVLRLNYKYPFFPSSEQTVVYVSRSGNNSNGTTWGNAYTSIQRAVDNAPRGAQIWIASGIYDGPVDITLREGLYLMGGFRGDETALWQRNVGANRTVIHGFNRVRNVLIIRSSSYIRLDGLLIRAGNAEGGTNFQQYGGGLHLLGGGQSIRIVNCTFENNLANLDGGAVYASIGASPLFIHCTFSNNQSRNNGGAMAVYCNGNNGYSTRVYHSIFDNNKAINHGGAIFFQSSAYNKGQLYLSNGLFTNNTTLGVKGTIALEGSADFILANSTFGFNRGNAYGAAVASLSSVPGKSRIVNSIFYRNTGTTLFKIEGEAEKPAGNVYPNIWTQFIHCLFYENETASIVRRNFDHQSWHNVNALNQSMIGVNCLEINPSFVNIEEKDFRLKPGSDARNKGASFHFNGFNLDGQKRSMQSINIGCY